MYHQHYFNDAQRGLPRFDRALLNRLLFKHASNEHFSAKFAVQRIRSASATEHLIDSERANYAAELHLLDSYRDRTRELLTLHAQVAATTLRRQPRNCSVADLHFVQRLMTDASITIKPADKNLGMVLVSTDWYNAELDRMLKDRVTYKPLQHFVTVRSGRGSKTTLALPKLQSELAAQLKALAKSSETSLKLWNPHLHEQVLRYLTGSVTLANCAVPGIYLLIKVHKASGLSGRPIVPSTRWLTTPASVLVDHLLQEVLREARIEHLVKDTKSFVNELEALHMPTRDGVFLTADIASLYTNIDTADGLRQVQRFLNLRGVSERHSELIMALLRFVMSNSYLTFRDNVWHQVDGTAMGTACAPAYANIVVYIRERDVLDAMGAHIFLYRRFLDDVFAYLERHAVAELRHRLNSMHPKLRFDFVVDEHEASFLDLRIHKGARFQAEGRFDLSVHQKKMNLYLYIPYRSFHPDAMKRAFIQTELLRYIRNSSSEQEYYDLRSLFHQRLRDRGYPSAFLTPLFNAVRYEDRGYFLWPSKQLLEHPQLHAQPPRSELLLRRLQRLRAAAAASDAESQCGGAPLVFVVPYSPLSRALPTRSLLARHWAVVQEALGEPTLQPPLIAYQSAPSLLRTLVYQRARRLEESRQADAERQTSAAAARRDTQESVAQQASLLRRFLVPTALASPAAAAAEPPRPAPGGEGPRDPRH
jgi:hypothetical protein